MTEAFLKALNYTLQFEGLYSNVPGDHGGATMKGVTQQVYNQWRDAHGMHRIPVRQITDQEIQDVYFAGYWMKIWGDQLPDKIAVCAFDYAVNSGPSHAVRDLQRLTGAKSDGQMGPSSLQKIAMYTDEHSVDELAEAYLDLREGFLRGLADNHADQQKFLHGWLRRVNGLRDIIGVGDGTAGLS